MIGTGRLKAFKACLAAGKPGEFIAFLNSEARADDLVVIREQKLLLLSANLQNQASVVLAYTAAIEKLLNKADMVRERNYVEFAVRCTQVFQSISNCIGDQIVYLRRLDKRSILATAEDVLTDYQRGMIRDRQAALDDQPAVPVRERSEMTEHLLHEFNGLNNELYWAVSRVLNDVLKVASDSTTHHFNRREKENAKREFLCLVFQAIEWNSWQYLLDKVTYGEWKVMEIAGSPVPDIKFEIVDVKSERAKLIGIRRHLSDTIRRMELGSKEVGPLEDFGVSCAIRFVEYYLRRLVTERELGDLMGEFRRQLKVLLTFFGRGDDLLLGASGGDFRVIGEYLTAIMLRAWVFARRKAASMSVKGQRARIRESGLPVGVCKEIAQSQGWPAAIFAEILESNTTGLPAANYFDLVKNPFLRCGAEIHSIGMAAFNDWPAVIQSRAIQGGAMAEQYGGLWEDYCAKLLADFGWLILGRNIKVKSKHQILTDIDILALKGGLLLVVEFKALGIGAATVYEHWLARSKIVRGIGQARLAIEALQPGSELLRGLLAGKKVKEWPARVQPLVITTADIFTGWNPDQIPVSSIKSLVSILNGATVKFTTNAGSVVSTETFIREEEANPEELLGLLNLPLDWRIADDDEQIQYKTIQTKFGKVLMPELTRKKRPRARVEFCGASVANL